MAFSAAQLATELRAMIADAPVSLVFAGQTNNCTPAVMSYSTTIMDEGKIGAYRRSVSICIQDWNTPPAADDSVTVGGVKYVVLRHDDDDLGVERRLDLGEENALP